MGSMLLLVLDVVDGNFYHLSPLVLVASGQCPTRRMSLICFEIHCCIIVRRNPLLYLILSISPVDYLPFLTCALRWHHWSDEAATCAPSTKPSFTRSDPPCPLPLLLLQRCVFKKKMPRVEIRVFSTARGARMATQPTPAL